MVPPLEQRPPTPDSVRTGLIAIKVGMGSEWDEFGVLTPLTALWFDENQVGSPKQAPVCASHAQVMEHMLLLLLSGRTDLLY
jgi:hypothetical protein